MTKEFIKYVKKENGESEKRIKTNGNQVKKAHEEFKEAI